MYEQQINDVFFHLLYGGVTAFSFLACLYLLFRRSNAIAPEVRPPVRLRRWTAAFFASLALMYIWYVPAFFLTRFEDLQLHDLIGDIICSLVLVPIGIVVMITMLQDRRRPLWPAFVLPAPLVAGVAWCIATRSPIPRAVSAYIPLLGLALIIYMVVALRQYGRWLHDNYADLEHKELWQSFVVMAVMMLLIGFYASDMRSTSYYYGNQLNSIMIVCFLLWRVETLSDLSAPRMLIFPVEEENTGVAAVTSDAADEEPDGTDECSDLSPETDDARALQLITNKIEPLLKQHCEESQFYLQYDLTVSQLAKRIGTNRSYLSRYFGSQGITYNAYINGLRVKHFVGLYREAVDGHRAVTAQQLAYESGFHSYSTFSAAFKQMMGMTATEWMRSIGEHEQLI